MTFRDKQIYVSAKTMNRLHLIRQVLQGKPDLPIAGIGTSGQILTIDKIADRMLNDVIEQRYPNIKALEKRMDALEGQFIVELSNGAKNAETK